MTRIHVKYRKTAKSRESARIADEKETGLYPAFWGWYAPNTPYLHTPGHLRAEPQC